MRLRLSNSWQGFRERIRHKHRLILIDADTFKEKLSVELTGVNIFTYVGIGVIVMIVLSMLLISFTPLCHFVPGYIRPEQREEIMRSAQTIDSLERVIEEHNQMIVAIQDIVSGRPLTQEQKRRAEKISMEAAVYRHTSEDSLLRQEIESRQRQLDATRK